MQNRQNPLGGAYVTGLEARDEIGAYAVDAAWRPVGSYTGTGIGRALGRFVDTQFRRPGTATSSTRTATGSLRTATGSFRTA
ncbi:hypothetical protein SAMN05660766_2440 [Curtobacterium sp. 314Chir4.1]|jgi:hypothetical protein|uniref:hypothetical protein n=1 Tax=Curtobacterium TaxID=2034 RepID=UPI000BC82BE6|nr:hypothetical protein [Curtobacterium sp. 314Chir4.1]SOC88728.1 hypothetical protein SAMN05660766_2440 [Curtobacterium sp. 314Chir4.1]